MKAAKNGHFGQFGANLDQSLDNPKNPRYFLIVTWLNMVITGGCISA
jgi:hypothetical protein